jgi:plastocyanin
MARDPKNFAVAPTVSSRARHTKQKLLRSLRLAALFATLTSVPCLAADEGGASAGQVANISIDHNTFIPDQIAVAPSTTITWTNKEAMPHTVVDVNKGFRSKTLTKDASFSFTFATAGDYDYFCSIHPNMKARVIVKPAN